MAALTLITIAPRSRLAQPAVAAPPAVEGILLKQSTGVGMGGAITLKYVPHVLFADGSITSDLRDMATTSADFAAWRARDPSRWGTARLSGETVEVRWPDGKTDRWAKMYRARPADASLQLDGRYRDLGGTGNTALGGSQLVAVWTDYTFGPGAAFERGGGAGATASSGGGSVVTSSTAPGARGTYVTDRWTISFTDDRGVTQRTWFYRFPDSDRTIGIGMGTYLKRR
ncbi:MAG: hypothetical protein MUE41_11110 [Gemmatimonadaceae bacterium]|jgi:hypothetical protein|nr:hypothetical protein [Gemmatimonadaceae bacterium]